MTTGDPIRPGDVLADRYRLEDVLTESGGGRFWRAHDRVLERYVALHVLAEDDPRALSLLEAARVSATVSDVRLLRVLDAEVRDGVCFVVNEWATGTSLDIAVTSEGPLVPRRAAWVVAEVADTMARAHAAGVAHGRLVPENVLVDRTGSIRLIGFCVDAALHGTEGDLATDRADLAGLLYCALTGRWAGSTASAVPSAPSEHGSLLRPRQVRAGVPRTLDDLCLRAEPPSARELADQLGAFVGDPTGIAEVLAGRHPATLRATPLVLPPEPGPQPVQPPEGTATAAPESPAEPEASLPATEETEEAEEAEETEETEAPPGSPGGPPAAAELPTVAGLPIFHETDDEVAWLTARSAPAPPPPPFEEQAERPLFAEGAERRPRPGAAGPEAGRDYWPWDTETGARTGGVGRVQPETADRTEGRGGRGVPGRSWLRLAALVAGALVLLLAIVVAYNLGRGKTILGAEDDTDPSGNASAPTDSESPTLQPITGLVATAFDPQGDPPDDENNDETPLAVDGDPSTSWSTVVYNDQLGPPPGLKTGVGLLVDLGSSQEVGAVELTTVGGPTSVEVYVADSAPDGLRGLTAAARGEVGARPGVLELDAPTSGQFLVVWLTDLPPAGGGFQGAIAEIEVLGAP